MGEVGAESASAKEIRELWTYVQGRLARLKNDAAFTPKAEPPDLAISGLSPTNASEPADARDVVEPKVMSVPTPPPQPESNTFRILARAWKAVLPLRHGMLKSSRGWLTLRMLCVLKT